MKQLLVDIASARDLSNDYFEQMMSRAIQERNMSKDDHPHKSTTHEEKFFHFQTPESPYLKAITVFARKESDGLWYSTPAFCVRGDEFNRKLGRTISRRRYFNDVTYRAKLTLVPDQEIDYEGLKLAMVSIASLPAR